MTGRTPGSPRTPGSGRKRGSLDREARQLLSGKMAAAIWKTYRELGPDWLTQLARDKPELFCSVFLQRLLPPALKDPEGDAPLVNINLSNDPIQAARLIAFALARGMDAAGNADQAVEQRQPYSRIAPDVSPQELLHQGLPDDPEHEAWARQAALTPEERINSESLDERCSRIASGPSSPAPAVVQKTRVPVRLHNPRNREDLL